VGSGGSLRHGKGRKRWRATTRKPAGRLQALGKKETNSEDCVEKIQLNCRSDLKVTWLTVGKGNSI
jgi:hypothetical protein